MGEHSIGKQEVASLLPDTDKQKISLPSILDFSAPVSVVVPPVEVSLRDMWEVVACIELSLRTSLSQVSQFSKEVVQKLAAHDESIAKCNTFE